MIVVCRLAVLNCRRAVFIRLNRCGCQAKQRYQERSLRLPNTRRSASLFEQTLSPKLVPSKPKLQSLARIAVDLGTLGPNARFSHRTQRARLNPPPVARREDLTTSCRFLEGLADAPQLQRSSFSAASSKPNLKRSLNSKCYKQECILLPATLGRQSITSLHGGGMV